MSGTATKQSSRVDTHELLIGAHRDGAEAVAIARETMNALATQQEDLETVEETLAHHEYILQKTERVLRSMNIFGQLYNLFSSEPVAPTSSSIGSAAESVNSTPRPANPLNSTSQPFPRQEHLEFPRNEIKLSESDAELQRLGATVDELKAITERMAETLENSTQQLQRIDDQSQKVHDETVQLTMKTSRMLQSARHTSKVSVGLFTFFANEGRFLAAEGDTLVLRDSVIDRRCIWEVFRKEEGVFGFQNAHTQKWIGISFLGYIRVASTSFGPSEHMYMDLADTDSSLLCPSANFGGGGWVVARGATPEGWAPLDAVTSGAADRKGAVVFRVERVEKVHAQALLHA